jgi:hypothetical protein
VTPKHLCNLGAPVEVVVAAEANGDQGREVERAS